MVKVSVIVPVYNVEKYLTKCLDSIIHQTYKNLEIILIDDGSTDNCGKICDAYAEKDSRIIIMHKKNEGIAIARNCGLKIAKGKYVIFVDSDDWVERDFIEYLYTHVNINNIVCCGYNRITNNEVVENRVIKILRLNKIEALEMLENYEMLFKKYNPISNALWNKIYPRHIFENISFPQNAKYEDMFVIIKIFNNIDKVVVLPDVKYNYFTRNNSIINKPQIDSAFDFISARLEQEEDLKDNYKLLKYAKILTLYACFVVYANYYYNYYKLTNSEEIYLKKIIKERKTYVDSKHYKLLIKIYLLLYFKFALKLLYKTKRKIK